MKAITLSLLVIFSLTYCLKSQTYSYIEELRIFDIKRPNAKCENFQSDFDDTINFYTQPRIEAKLIIIMKEQKNFSKSRSVSSTISWDYNKKTYFVNHEYISCDRLNDSTIVCNLTFHNPFGILKEIVKNDNYLPLILEILPTIKIIFRYDYIDNDEYKSNVIKSSYIRRVEMSWDNYR